MNRFQIETAPREDIPRLVETLIEIDDQAGELFRRAGVTIDLPRDHPFVAAEYGRWGLAARAGHVLWATAPSGEVLGFAAHGQLDGLPYLEQLAVRPSAMRRGLGRSLTEAVVAHARERGERALWLTTYGHLPWNAPLYERLGFVRVDEAQCGAELRATLAEQRSVLPAPEQRVAMVRAL